MGEEKGESFIICCENIFGAMYQDNGQTMNDSKERHNKSPINECLVLKDNVCLTPLSPHLWLSRQVHSSSTCLPSLLANDSHQIFK